MFGFVHSFLFTRSRFVQVLCLVPVGKAQHYRPASPLLSYVFKHGLYEDGKVPQSLADVLALDHPNLALTLAFCCGTSQRGFFRFFISKIITATIARSSGASKHKQPVIEFHRESLRYSVLAAVCSVLQWKSTVR